MSRVTTTEITPEKIAALEAEVRRLATEVAEKQTIIEELLRRLYRPKSEAFNPAQLGLFEPIKEMGGGQSTESVPPTPPTETTKPAKKPGHGRTSFPDRLPRETKTTDLDAKSRTCSKCGETLRSIGAESCERGHIQPVKVIVKRWVMHKYACPNGHEVKTSEGAPNGLVERAKWTTESYAFVVVSKYQDHQPLERIEKSLKRHGIDVPASTLNSMIDVVGEKLALVVEQAKREILADDHLEGDATGIKTFREVPGKTAGAKPTKELRGGNIWVWKAGKKLLMDFHWSSGSEAPLKFLAGWSGTLLTDGSSSFDAVCLARVITRAGCWAHARRKFKEALDLGVADALPMIVLMKRLYRIESAIKKRLLARRANDPADDDALRLRVRRRRSAKMISRIDAELRRLNEDVRPIPKSPLGKATTYIERQWTRLIIFRDDPKVPIDNNGVENAIRPIAVGRRNYGFAGSERGANNAAVLYSIINTCNALEINAYDYLVDVLDQVSPNADLKALTPWAWKERRNAATAPTTQDIF